MADPNFLPAMVNPFGLADVGRGVKQTLADIDGDGDLDIFVGNRSGNIRFFQNNGDAENPSFATREINPFGLTDVGKNAVPTLTDIDNDGDLDAFVGSRDGNIRFFRNDGDANNPNFAAPEINPFGLNMGNYSTPTFADIDGDGDLDALVGNSNGNTEFFRNDGDANNPSFAVSETNPFGLADAGGFVTPTLADIDNDGDLDAFVGNSGNISFFENSITAEDDTVSIDEDNVVSGNLFDDNGNGADNGNGQTFNVTQVNDDAANVGSEITLPSGALLTVNADGTFSYDPNGQFEDLNDGETGTDSFTYTITDSNGDTDTATVTVTIDGVTDNTAPVAVDDTDTTDEDTVFTTGDVLENDTDADNDTLTVTEVNGQSANVDNQITLTSGALLTVNSDGTYSYDPNGQFESLNDGETNTDSFAYTISDGNGGTDTATVTVTIDGVDEAPELPPNSLESDYTIFTRNVSGTEYSVEFVNSQPVYIIDDTATNQSLNDFLSEVVSELGGTVTKNGTINENALEYFGSNQNPSITENLSTDKVTIKIAGSGVGGQYKAEFDNNADANAFQEFAQDILGKDPTPTNIFQFNGGTNGGSNNIRILINDEIASLNSESSDSLRTPDSLEFKWSGADTSGTQVRNNFDDFIGEMGDLFGGDQLTNADIHVIPTLNEAQLTGTQVEISNGIGDTETWNFNNEQEAQNFLTFFDSTVDAFAV